MKQSRDEWLRAVVAQLLPEGPRSLTLDEVGEAIGQRQVGSEDVELLLQKLEALGAKIVGQGGEGLAPLLRRVLAAARDLRSAGKKPSPARIAEESGLSARAVRVALLYAEVLKG